MSKNKIGKVILQPDADVWPHEISTAKSLAKAGFIVEFRANKNIEHIRSPDVLIDNKVWEIKSPRSTRLASIERNLKKASRQSRNIIFDSQRMGKLPDRSIQRELIKQFRLTKPIKNLILINRKRQIIDISKLV